MFTLKATNYRFGSTQPSQINYKNNLGVQYLLFCDPVTQDIEAQKVVENIIHERMSILSSEKISEATLTTVLQYANAALLDWQKKEKKDAFVSALLMAIQPSEKGTNLIVVGSGDCRIFQIDPEAISLTFYDLKNPYQAVGKTIQKRLISLENALGKKPSLYVHTRKIFKATSQRYLIATAGVFQQATEKELQNLGMGLDKIESFLANCLERENALMLSQVVLENASIPLPSSPIKAKPRGKHTIKTVAIGSLLVLGSIFYILNSNMTKSLQKQAQTQSEMISLLKQEIEARGKELQELKAEITQQVKSKQPSFNIEAANKAIDELGALVREKEQLAIRLAKESESNFSKASEHAIQAINSQLEEQFDTLEQLYSEQQVKKTALSKVVTDIKQSLLTQESLELTPELVKKEVESLQALIIHLQESVLHHIDQEIDSVAS